MSVPVGLRSVLRDGIEGVTFDFWNTLMWERPGDLVRVRIERWLELFADEGVPMSPSRLESAHAAAFQAYQEAWRANRQFVVHDAASVMANELDIDPTASIVGRITAGFAEAGSVTPLRLADGVAALLQRLHAAGVRLGIVCDIGLTPSSVLREHLDRQGLLALFGGWAFSDEVGVYKPDPTIFEVVLDALGIGSPERTLHVGDRRRTDVAGALAAGMVPVRYAGIFEDDIDPTPEADLVVNHFDDLLTSISTVAPG